jgi:multiple antibiotic resistance protein
MTVLSATLLLFLVLDPIGNIPLFLCSLKSIDSRRHKRIIIRESCIGLALLLLFLFAGRYILLLLQISQSSLSIAGGIILFLIALKMIFRGSEEIFGNATEGEPFIVPLAIPLIAGPSAMTTVILLMAREPSRWLDWFVALMCAWLLSCVILLFSNRLSRIFGNRGLIALERLMGLILTTVAVQMLITGIRQSFFS